MQGQHGSYRASPVKGPTANDCLPRAGSLDITELVALSSAALVMEKFSEDADRCRRARIAPKHACMRLSIPASSGEVSRFHSLLSSEGKASLDMPRMVTWMFTPLRKDTHMARLQHTVLVNSFHAPLLFHGQARPSRKKQFMSQFSQVQQDGDAACHKHAGGPQNRVGVTIVALRFAVHLHDRSLPWLTLEKHIGASVSQWQLQRGHRRLWKHWQYQSMEMRMQS